MEVDISIEEPKDEDLRLPCPACTASTFHKVLLSAKRSERFDPAGYHVDIWFQVVQCQGCRTLSFRRLVVDSDDYQYDQIAGEYVAVERESLYPSRVEGRRQLPDAHYLPFTVSSLYKETLAALANDSPILAGIGIRALVEAVCKERNASGRNLEKRIDDLVTLGVLTASGSEILHSLRLVGNEAAHEAKPHTKNELLVGMDVVENLLNTVYLIPKKADSLPKRQTDQSAS